ncbi:hypothetical protein MHIR_DE00619 [Candidatus Doolittlea endobia]|uniref:Uncharacterized protein n=1 Tax=Candidatus Doolittlea endobia TaxID=1778262 RepID=A0A143WTG8_9ENTR|nr:hypothetical protein MHIR_DE00619 [Candidatus Doolittlea endobia]
MNHALVSKGLCGISVALKISKGLCSYVNISLKQPTSIIVLTTDNNCGTKLCAIGNLFWRNFLKCTRTVLKRTFKSLRLG